MNNKIFGDTVVHIKNKAELKQIKKLLIKNNQKICKDNYDLDPDEQWNYLFYNSSQDDWSLSFKFNNDEEISIREFKVLFQNKNKRLIKRLKSLSETRRLTSLLYERYYQNNTIT